MKNKIVCLLLALVMVFSMVALTACGDKENPDGEKPDDNKKPGNNPGGNNGTEDAWWEDISYEETSLRFKMTKCSNNEELGSGCERYLAGTTADNGDIDTYVDERNEAAYYNTNVSVTYDYYDDSAAEYGWAKCIDIIFQEVQSLSSTTPDMYCNFMTDMLSTSILGSFANLRSRTRGEGDLYGQNFIDRDAAGYMGDLMSSLTLSKDKIYVIASDYFIDLIRAFFIVPVNVKMYNGIAPDMIADLNGDGVKDINDFFEEVWNLDWTYTRVAQYANKIYKNTSGQQVPNLGDDIGFALSSSSGLSAAGMVYTSSVVVIHKELQDDGAYKYYYPESGADLVALTDALRDLFNSPGVISVLDSEGGNFGPTSLQAIRYQFANNKVLFGGVILLGSLEYGDYQDMKKGEGQGFGVVPAPLFRTTNPNTNQPEKYQTQIHVVGRAGGIAHSTKKFAQCTAFVQYQSTHSTNILNEYYDYNLTYDIADGLDGNVDMLKYIRENVRSCFDKLFEDSIGFFFNTTDAESVANRWHNLISTARYKMSDMAATYTKLYGTKDSYLRDLVKQYERLPD